MDEMAEARRLRIYGRGYRSVVKALTLVGKDGGYVINRKYVGRNASVILRDAALVLRGTRA